MGEVTTATIAATAKNTAPTTFRSISGFALPSVIHNTQPLLQVSCLPTPLSGVLTFCSISASSVVRLRPSLSNCLYQLVSINLSLSTCPYQLACANLSLSTCLYQLVSVNLSLSTCNLSVSACLYQIVSVNRMSRLLCVAGAALGDSL